MAPSDAARGGVASPRDVLLATKLRPPQPRADRVPRPRLVQRLLAGTERELVLVCGPAGFGKSSLLAEWVSGDRRPVAWLSLDAGDNDPVRFWRHVVAALDQALDQVRPGLSDRISGVVAAASLHAAVTALVNDLVELADEVVLVMDDYHVVEAADVHRSVEFLLEHLPPALRLVVASRSDPPLPLARLRARGELTEVRAADLRFTADETAALLRTALGSALSDPVVAALGERTEGWAAGLHLAALSLRGRADIAPFVERFSGSHRYVLDYLTEEVLARLSDETRTFLLETSVLERLSGPLCDAVVGRTDSQQVLEAVERANLFLIALDEDREWWRYHHLFADLLRVNLMRLHPDRAAELHRAAADWYARHDLADEAVRHALAAGDTAWAARLVEEHLEEQVWRRGEGATLVVWLAALPVEEVARRPVLTLGQAMVTLMAGRLDEVEPLLAAVEHVLDEGIGEPYCPSIDRRSSILGNVAAGVAVCRAELARMRGDAAGEDAAARTALAHATEQDMLLGSIARYHVAVADWLAGRLAPAEHGLAAVFEERFAAERHDLAVRAAFELGSVQQARGRLRAARRTYRRGIEVAAAGSAPSTAGMAHVGLAEVCYERDELDAATAHLATGVELCRHLAYVPALVAGLLTLARIRAALGDPAGAVAAVDEAAAAMPAAVVDVRNPLPALRMRLALARGDLDAVTRWVRERGPAVDDEPDHLREPDHRVLARWLVARGEPGAALAMLARWHDLAVAQGRAASVLHLRVLAALAHERAGDRPSALAAVAEALALAAPEGYLRVFLDEGPVMAALLADRRLVPGDVPAAFLARLAVPAAPAVASALVTPLSAREQEVLALLAMGHPNRAIAEKLYITVDTVKRHVSHVFEKLGVTNRTQAVAQARDRGLL